MRDYDFTKQPSVLIQGAMSTETKYLINQLSDPHCVTLGNWEFYTGFLGKYGEPVIISRTYQGTVNAAAATSLALVHFAVKAVINQGIGGGHDVRFHRGDIILGEHVVPMGAVIYRPARKDAGINPAGFDPLPVEVYNPDKKMTEKVQQFPCDERLLAIAEKVETRAVVGRGIIGSADEWNNQVDRIAMLREKYGTVAEDMESAAPAELCLSYGKPFLAVRILSNSIVNGERFDEAVGVNCQKFIISFIEALHSCPEI